MASGEDSQSPVAPRHGTVLRRVVNGSHKKQVTHWKAKKFHPCYYVIVSLCYLLMLITSPFSWYFCLKAVKEYEVLSIFRLGRLLPPKKSGINVILPCIDNWTICDMRTRAFNVPPQQILTQDKATISIGASIYYRIHDANTSIMATQDLNCSSRTIAQTSVKNILTTKTVQEIESKLPHLNDEIQISLNKETTLWGMEIQRVELTLPRVLRRQDDTSNPILLPDYAYTPKTDINFVSPGYNTTYVTPGHNTINYDSTALEMLNTSSKSHVDSTEAYNAKENVKARLSPHDIITAIDGLCNRIHVANVGAVYQLDLEISRGVTETYYIDLKYGDGSAGVGKPRNCKPDCIISISEEDMVDLFTRQISAKMAYMQGRLRVSGNIGSAMKLESFLSSLAERVV
ncbi:uncharacterized protein TRIADDRAFT_55845 [Trichoplax adhaerens]|uniref:Band 7 domain-containing protein n=1 Tax=Trichoplax adhaerens TaxID=10228 RepID=B3RW09_TRIAD|nr:hypothetical protein TRIADDRAFT_55845 [Trichoplax adhaerens]EDV25589.1 hypothetical protein TRIADDRAFT_55845 [Trichoplax adhaerens]|eukprot:XP_002111622.1 hypothetical protein TRIADDRAFT_55845 [Trichoplax adhaerens]